MHEEEWNHSPAGFEPETLALPFDSQPIQGGNSKPREGPESPRPWRQDFAMLRELLRDGGIKPAIDRRYRLEQTAEVHRYVDTGRKKGNVVITVG